MYRPGCRMRPVTASFPVKPDPSTRSHRPPEDSYQSARALAYADRVGYLVEASAALRSAYVANLNVA